MVGGGLAPLTQQPVFSREGVGLSRARRWRNPPELHPATATEAKHSETGSVQFSWYVGSLGNIRAVYRGESVRHAVERKDMRLGHFVLGMVIQCQRPQH